MANLTRDTTTSQPVNIGTTLAGNLSNNTSSLFQRISTEESSPCPYFCDSSATSCGQPNSFSPRKIVGGESSQPHAWPWQVSLWKVNRLLCSATIICKGWVITSAHCFLDRSTFQMRYNGLHLRIGSHTRNINEDGISIRYLNSSQIYLHP
uniref:Peptidase S1 domain-containing protein n=1 Tax=Ciona savignyi TaxID=51511 RepID=H2Z617_CIOSA